MFRKDKKEKRRYADPLTPPDYTEAEAQAIRALSDGKATPVQQQQALNWIINTAAGTYDLSWRRGGVAAARDSDFAAGMRYVGMLVVHILKAAKTSTDADKISIRRLGEEHAK